MSEDDFLPSCDDDDYEFEYDDDEELGSTDDESNPEVMYYKAKNLREDMPEEALAVFRSITENHTSAEWALKAAKQSIKIALELRRLQDVQIYMASLIETLINCNESDSYKERCILTTFERILTGNGHMLAGVYEDVLTRFERAKMERFVWRIAISFARAYYDQEDYANALKVLQRVDFSTEPDQLAVNSWRAPLFVEYLALKIQLAIALKTGEEEDLCHAAKNVKMGMVHPRVAAVIEEYNGLVALEHQRWEDACQWLLKSFKSYDEAGMSDRSRILRLYSYACLLNDSGLNPLDNPETRAYLEYPDLRETKQVVLAFTNNDIEAFNEIISGVQDKYQTESAMMHLLPRLRTSFIKRVFLLMVKPYRKIRLKSLATQFDCEVETLRDYIKELILDKRLPHAAFDVIDNVLILNAAASLTRKCAEHSKFPLPERYAKHMQAIQRKKDEKVILNRECGIAEIERPHNQADLLQAAASMWKIAML